MSFRIGDVRPILSERPQSYNAIQDSDEEAGKATPAVPIWRSYRLLVSLMAQLGLLCSFASQSIMGASLLIMTGNSSDESGAANGTGEVGSWSTDHDVWHYAWSDSTQAHVMTAFFSGYFVVQIPAGLLTHRLGGKRIVLFGAGGLCLLQGLAVYTPRLGAPYFIATMVLCGITNGCIYVPLLDVLAKWVPPQESSTLVSLTVSGTGFGIAFVYSLSAFTSNVQLLGGWGFNFIALGCLLALFTLLMWLLVTEKPEDCRFISHKELAYIKASQAEHAQHAKLRNPGSVKHGFCGVPWRKIICSGPVLAICASQLGTDFMQYFYITLFSSYLTQARGLDNDTSDMIAGLPWLVLPLAGFSWSRLVDRIRQSECIKTTTLRKIADGIAKLMPMCVLVTIVYLPRAGGGALFALHVLTVALFSLEGSSWLANVVDVSPEYAGFISSVSQVASLPSSIFLPQLVDSLTPNDTDLEWQHCVLIMFAIVTSCYIVYVILGSSEPQDWTEEGGGGLEDESADAMVVSGESSGKNWNYQGTSRSH